MNPYGWLIEFSDPETLLAAARKARDDGFLHLDAHTPFPMDELPRALGLRRNWVPFWALLGGIFGGVGGFFMQWYANVKDYPINVAGRPDDSWPAFVPVTFELTVLISSFGAALAWLFLNRLPQVWHPVFNHPGFDRASQDRFFLCIKNRDLPHPPERIRTLMEPLSPLSIVEVFDEE